MEQLDIDMTTHTHTYTHSNAHTHYLRALQVHEPGCVSARRVLWSHYAARGTSRSVGQVFDETDVEPEGGTEMKKNELDMSTRRDTTGARCPALVFCSRPPD